MEPIIYLSGKLIGDLIGLIGKLIGKKGVLVSTKLAY